MNAVIYMIDWILFVPLAFCVSYLLFYAIASRFYRSPQYPAARKQHRFAVLFPAYREDRVIVNAVQSFLGQEYPAELYDVIVISDQMQPATNAALRQLPIHLLEADYTDSSKAKALVLAMEHIAGDAYDIVVVMDADNITTSNFLSEMNRAYDFGLPAIQARRTGKNLNTDVAMLDAVSEEINNGIFRSGHNAVGLSASLSGSGMAFDAGWFRRNVRQLQTAGEDKELETMLLRQNIHIGYLQYLPVYDEKTQKTTNIKNQRKRWIAAQFGALATVLPDLPKAFMQGNMDYCDKIFQWMLPPRLLQLAAVFGLALVAFIVCPPEASIKWGILVLAQIMAMLLPIPRKLLNRQLLKAVLKVPQLAFVMAGNLFKLKGANKKFIHTEHGEGEREREREGRVESGDGRWEKEDGRSAMQRKDGADH